MTISFRQARQSDWTAINKFIDEAYGLIAPYKGFARWDWQFASNPFRIWKGDLVPIWLALDGESIVGQIAVQPAIVQIDNRECPAGWMVDVMVLPNYRGQSLGHRLHDAVAADVPFLIMLTMAPATRHMALRAGCVTLAPVRQFVKLINLDSDTLRRYLVARTSHRPLIHPLIEGACDVLHGHRVLTAMANLWVHLRKKDRPLQHRNSIVSIEEVQVFNNEVDELWNRIRGSYPAIFSRNMEFLNWRFINAPDLHYRCFVARRSGKCVGYIVLRRTSAVELPFGVIVDLLTSPNDTQAIESLIDHAIVTFGKDVAAVECVSCVPEIDRVIQEIGFFSTRTVYPTVVCQDPILRQRVHELRDRWYFTKGDHDWDQIHPA